ncbi:hypothetical protein H9L22_05495 [Tessaracoccus defluvii]|uniref:Uncharacterized protein n=1 Tax=Tessaracoccus defluvii TaxID=1285901 RepID=A0A7H0H8E5_9ACTN|nr:hypothetical protein [Tessaracoccus defluvii]QNP56811.1 hypothetical protein H9L22_05495 [Tessaracoccus defluvii]
MGWSMVVYASRVQEKPPNGTFPEANSIATQTAGTSTGHARSVTIFEIASAMSPHQTLR